ncbi:MAG: hypothetical protein WAT39_06225 [Planctomycetota bacterium]
MNPSLRVSALALVLAACSSPPYAAQRIEDDAEMFANVVVTDSELYDVVKVGVFGVERVPGTNQLKVMVPIRNIDDEPIQILVQTGFLDGRKVPIGDETNQQVKVISPGATVLCEVISKKDTAQDWTMRLSWNR